MDKKTPAEKYLEHKAGMGGVTSRLRIISRALKDYLAEGKTVEQFAEEYGCDIIFDEAGYGIRNVKFHNSSNETMFMLKYDNGN